MLGRRDEIASCPACRPLEARALSAGRPKALIIEDEPTVSTVLVSMLESLGIDARAVASSAAATALLARESLIAIIFFDLSIGDHDPSPLATRLRAAAPGVRLVCISGRPARADEIEIIRNAAASFLLKPFGLEDLRRVIEPLLD